MNNDDDQKTGSQNTPDATDAKNAPATNQDKGSDTAKDGEETVTLSVSDYKKLQAQRDRNHTDAQKNAEKYSELEDTVNDIARERAINSFLTENKKDYPDVQMDDLFHVTPDTLESEAKRIQRRYQEVAQNRLKSVQRSGAPALSATDKASKLAQLKKDQPRDAFEQMANLRTSPTVD